MTSEDLAARVHQALLARGETVGCAESLTGGGLADLLSGTPGASATFAGGVVSYATRVKRQVLGVTAAQVVSADCASQMARGAQELLGVDWALATTGVAGPEKQDDKPVGTVYVGLAGPHGVTVHRLALDGDRGAVRDGAAHAALEALLDVLG
ncbi:CinA family protein [Nocardioides marmoriginsengisoli]|uniref:CinA family protein n=1 Tax=Nocardioides marmoriginsengisoli TaxID=661483 RepID=A0A3N0CQ71_9ACTN|nr:CinA family protein [Nocardioides marmoriginsengisoli]RNL65043.1 CinA family protein [Nocardioides marmoriginsengisoli]